jgi:hypothetical protein
MSSGALGSETVFLGDPATRRMILADSPDFSVFDDTGGGDINEFQMIDVRSLGGQDPLVQRQYLQLVDSEGDAGLVRPNRTPTLGPSPNFAWLANNGVKYLLTPAGAYPADPAERNLIFAGAGIDVWRLHNARPLISSDDGCALVSGIQLTANQLSFTIDAPRPGCVVRATLNYSAYWQVAGMSVQLRPIPGNLGFNLVNLPAGSYKVVLHYSDPWYSAGQIVALLGFLLLIGYLLRYCSRRRHPRSPRHAPV